MQIPKAIPISDQPYAPEVVRHPKCAGYRDDYTLEYDCGYDTILDCEDCKYGCGRKDPEAKCNQPNERTLRRPIWDQGQTEKNGC